MGQQPPWASQPQCSPVGTMAGGGREQGQRAWEPRESPGERRCACISTCPISRPAPGHPPCRVPSCARRPGSHPVQLPAAFPGRRPAPQAGPPLHKHHLAARLVLIVLTLSRIYHPAVRKQGVEALSFTPRSSRGHPAVPRPSRPPLMPPHPQGCSLQVLRSCLGQQQPGKQMSQSSGMGCSGTSSSACSHRRGWVQGSERPSRHPPREVTRKRWFC